MSVSSADTAPIATVPYSVSAVAESRGGNYSIALAVVAGFAALLIAIMMYFGPEAQNADMGREASVSE